MNRFFHLYNCRLLKTDHCKIIQYSFSQPVRAWHRAQPGRQKVAQWYLL